MKNLFIFDYKLQSVLLVGLCLVCATNVLAETPSIPTVAKPDVPISAECVAWKDGAYKKRYFLRVDAPGEAGAIGLQNDPSAASLILPIRLIQSSAASENKPVEEPEKVLLVGEDNVVYPVLIRKISGGSDVEIAFATRPGLRRFCLYTDLAETEKSSADATPQPASEPQPTAAFSPTTFRTQALRVKLRARTLTAETAYRDNNPLTLERFTAIHEIGDGVIGEKLQSTINNPENPWFDIRVDSAGHLQHTENKQSYAAVYEAFLRTPVAGTYTFAIDTPGVAHLLINGKPVLGTDKPNPSRSAFELTGRVDLAEGIQRIVVYYAEAVTPPGKTATDLSRFGLRLHWQPPFAKELLCIPAQAFPRALPAIVLHSEVLNIGTQPFIHLENLGQVRTGTHHGETHAREWVLFSARLSGIPEGSFHKEGEEAKLCFESDETVAIERENSIDAIHGFAWLPISKPVTFVIQGAAGKLLARRSVTWPTQTLGARDVLDLEGAMLLKASPDFLYPDETAHFHLETLLAPAPVIIPKVRRENNLLPAPSRPMGEFVVTGSVFPNPNNALPFEQKAPGMGRASRDKQRLSLAGEVLEKYSFDSTRQFKIRLRIGGVPAEDISIHLLHSRSKQWSCAANGMKEIEAGAGSLLIATPPSPNLIPPPSELSQQSEFSTPHNPSSLLPQLKESLPNCEKVMIVVPRENEAEYRRFAALKSASNALIDTTALFIGDPLIEFDENTNYTTALAQNLSKRRGRELAATTPTGLAGQIKKAYPNLQWRHVLLPGPHRQLPIFRMIAELEGFSARAPRRPFPKTVVVSLGTGDAARQTPLHNFERGVDVLIDRLKTAGAQRIIIIGVIPEPCREKHAEPYHEKVQDLVRQHHLECLNVFELWTKENNWEKRFALDETSDSSFGPTPNEAAREEIVKLLKEKL